MNVVRTSLVRAVAELSLLSWPSYMYPPSSLTLPLLSVEPLKVAVCCGTSSAISSTCLNASTRQLPAAEIAGLRCESLVTITHTCDPCESIRAAMVVTKTQPSYSLEDSEVVVEVAGARDFTIRQQCKLDTVPNELGVIERCPRGSWIPSSIVVTESFCCLQGHGRTFSFCETVNEYAAAGSIAPHELATD